MAFNYNDHRWSPWSERETPALVADKEALVMRQSAADAAARREETLLLMLGRQQEQLRQTASKSISSPARSVPQETVLVEQITAAGETVLVETVLPGTRRVLRVLRDGLLVCGRRFHFFGAKEGKSMEDCKAYFIAERGVVPPSERAVLAAATGGGAGAAPDASLLAEAGTGTLDANVPTMADFQRRHARRRGTAWTHSRKLSPEMLAVVLELLRLDVTPQGVVSLLRGIKDSKLKAAALGSARSAATNSAS